MVRFTMTSEACPEATDFVRVNDQPRRGDIGNIARECGQIATAAENS
jgi:hypothetical protein